MQRSQLEAALCATVNASNERELVLVGSQAVHAYTNDPPEEVLISEECDIFVRGKFEKFERIGPVLGKNSPFHVTNGFFVDPVEPGIILLPEGWESRLIPMPFDCGTAWCLEINDLVVSKLNAGRF